MARNLVLEGVDNFRDFGDYPVNGGGRIKPGLLYRSAHHGQATKADLESIGALGLSTIVDLRRRGERERDPARLAANFTGQVVFSDHAAEVEDEWRVHITTSDLTPESCRAYLVGYYEKAPFTPRHLELFSRYFEILAGADGPVLIHCAAGKDRTGILAALTLHLLGAHQDDIISDYLLTNDEERLRVRVPQVEAMVRELTGREPGPGAMRVAIGVEAEYLERSFEVIEQEYGGLDRYLEQGLGIGPERRRTIEDRLLA